MSFTDDKFGSPVDIVTADMDFLTPWVGEAAGNFIETLSQELLERNRIGGRRAEEPNEF